MKQYGIGRVSRDEDDFDEVGPGASGTVTDEMDALFERMLSMKGCCPDKSVKDLFLAQEKPMDRWLFEMVDKAYIATDYAADATNLSSMFWLEDPGTGGYSFGEIMPGGYQQIFDNVMAEKKLDIRLNTVVQLITYANNSVTVKCVDGREFRAKQVILTVPLGVLQHGSIQFNPQLSGERMRAIEALSMGRLVKIYLEFPRGSLPMDPDTPGAYRIPSRGKQLHPLEPLYFLNLNSYNPSKNGILIEVGGERSIELEQMTDEQVGQFIFPYVQEAFPHVKGYSDIRVTRWGLDPFSYGAYSFQKVGMNASTRQVIGKAIGNWCFFAGEHLSKHPAYVHGAWDSGVAAAAESIKNRRT